MWGTDSVTVWMVWAQSQTTWSVLVFWQEVKTRVRWVALFHSSPYGKCGPEFLKFTQCLVHLFRETLEVQWLVSRDPCGFSLVLWVLVLAVLGLTCRESTPECPVTSPGSTPTLVLISQALSSLPPVGWMLTAPTPVLAYLLLLLLLSLALQKHSQVQFHHPLTPVLNVSILIIAEYRKYRTFFSFMQINS